MSERQEVADWVASEIEKKHGLDVVVLDWSREWNRDVLHFRLSNGQIETFDGSELHSMRRKP